MNMLLWSQFSFPPSASTVGRRAMDLEPRFEWELEFFEVRFHHRSI